MKSEALRGSLDRLEAVLVRADAAVVPLMRPGLPEGRVRSLLGELGLEPTPEILEWFGWHDGARRDGERAIATEIVPGGEFYDLESMCEGCREAREVTRQLVQGSDDPESAAFYGQLWRSTWLPLLHLFGKGDIVVELPGGGAAVSPVHVVWLDTEPEMSARVAWPSIQAFVDDVVARFESGEYCVDEQGLVQGEVIDFPT